MNLTKEWKDRLKKVENRVKKMMGTEMDLKVRSELDNKKERTDKMIKKMKRILYG